MISSGRLHWLAKPKACARNRPSKTEARTQRLMASAAAIGDLTACSQNPLDSPPPGEAPRARAPSLRTRGFLNRTLRRRATWSRRP